VVDWTMRTENAFNKVCANCGTPENIQMHHVKHIKTVNVKLSPFVFFKKKKLFFWKKKIIWCLL
jgi:hypothetical protein